MNASLRVVVSSWVVIGASLVAACSSSQKREPAVQAPRDVPSAEQAENAKGLARTGSRPGELAVKAREQPLATAAPQPEASSPPSPARELDRKAADAIPRPARYEPTPTAASPHMKAEKKDGVGKVGIVGLDTLGDLTPLGGTPAASSPAQAFASGHALGSGTLHLQMARARVAASPTPQGFNTEAYAHRKDSDFLAVAESPLSTFSIDVDTASYSNVRRFLNDGQRPPADAVRIEEMINYFRYDYPSPHDGRPFAVEAEVGPCPWAPTHRLVRLGVQGMQIAAEKVPPRNLVFLIDVSGSMDEPNKLPLLQRGLALLVQKLRPEDKVAMVVYAGATGLALPATSGKDRARILEAIERLQAGGSTNGGAGIELAYQIAQQNFVRGGINRVVLATDGDFNVGVTSEGELVRLIEEKKKSGVFLTVLGFGSGNLQDARMESLADKGDGNYAYVDSLAEAHKVLVREAGSTLVAIAKDVKLQVEFNPKRVARYRLIGYENRLLAAQDFNDDKKDAGEIGAGHSVTALYEVVPVGAPRSASDQTPAVDPLRYQTPSQASAAAQSDELMTFKVRYKEPQGATSQLLAFTVADRDVALSATSADFRFAAAVAGFGMVLRGSEHRGSATLASVRALAQNAVGNDLNGDRHELVALLSHASALGIQ